MRKINLKLFPKMFLMSFITILSTILLFSFIFRLVYSSYIKNFTQQQFSKDVNHLQEELKNTDFISFLTEGTLTKFESDRGLRVMIVDQYNQILYPYSPLEMYSNQDIIIKPDKIYVDTIIDEKDNTLSSSFNIYYNNDILTFIVQSGSYINDSQFSAMFFSTLPYMLSVGFILSAIISYIFASHISRKIKRLNNIMNDMETLSYIPRDIEVQGDEIVELENHIDNLYKKMLHEMNAIKKFEKDRELFMKGSIHELKTPLMIMNLHIETLMNQNLEISSKEAVIELYKKVNHMSNLVNEVLKASSLDSIISNENIIVKDLVKEVLEHYTYMLEDKNLLLNLNLDDSRVRITNQDFTKVFSNLMSNAVKFSKENDIITVDVFNNTLIIKNSIENTNDIDLDIFSPFVHHPDHLESHGLGLYIVGMILHKYEYQYEAKNDKNSFTFTINFNKEP